MSETSIERNLNIPNKVNLAEEIFAQHGDFIRSIIRFNVKNEALSEDLFQDLFLFLVLKPIPEKVQNVRGFLYRVVSDKAKDAFRKIDRYQGRVHRYAERRRCIIDNRPEKSLIEIEETKKMFELIEKHLPKNQARALTLRYIARCDTTEAAEKMKVKPRTISRYVSVGLKRMRDVFSESKEGHYYESL